MSVLTKEEQDFMDQTRYDGDGRTMIFRAMVSRLKAGWEAMRAERDAALKLRDDAQRREYETGKMLAHEQAELVRLRKQLAIGDFARHPEAVAKPQAPTSPAAALEPWDITPAAVESLLDKIKELQEDKQRVEDRLSAYLYRRGPITEQVDMLVDQAMQAKAEVTRLREACNALPLEQFDKDMSRLDAADFVDNANAFMEAMSLARAALAKLEEKP